MNPCKSGKNPGRFRKSLFELNHERQPMIYFMLFLLITTI